MLLGVLSVGLTLAGAVCAGAHRDATLLTLHGTRMGTTWTVKLNAADADVESIRILIDAELDNVVAEMSAWEADSALSRFNRAAPGSTHDLPRGLCRVLGFGIELAEATDGAFDPTLGALTRLWGFGPDSETRAMPPSVAQIREALAHTGFRRIGFDPQHCTATQPGGVLLDVSSLGPGHALDQIGRALRTAGHTDFLLELGGEMLASGTRDGARPWQVAVENAEGTAQRVTLHDQAAGSSGDYRVQREHQGRRWSHTLDARSGEPVTHGLHATTVIADSALEADGWASAGMVVGADRFASLCRTRRLQCLFAADEG